MGDLANRYGSVRPPVNQSQAMQARRQRTESAGQWGRGSLNRLAAIGLDEARKQDLDERRRAAAAEQSGMASIPALVREPLYALGDTAASLQSTMVRPFNRNLADDMLDQREVLNIQRAKDREGDLLGETFSGLLGGASGSIATMAAAAPFGVPGVIATFGATRGNEALKEAADAGLEGIDRTEYAARATAIEAGITTVFQGLGLGGAESLVAGRTLAGELAKTGTATAFFKQLARQTAAESVEEVTVSTADLMNQAFSGVNPNALNPDNVVSVLGQTLGQTALTMGIASSPSAVRAYINNPSRTNYEKLPPGAQQIEGKERGEGMRQKFAGFLKRMVGGKTDEELKQQPVAPPVSNETSMLDGLLSDDGPGGQDLSDVPMAMPDLKAQFEEAYPDAGRAEVADAVRQPYQKTREEFAEDGFSPGQADGIITKKVGSSEAKRILEYYQEKYPELQGVRIGGWESTPESGDLPDAGVARIVRENGKFVPKESWIHLPKNASPTTVRHEIEHLLDVIHGKTDAEILDPKTGKESFGRFRHEFFASDYTHRQLIKDAQRDGKTIRDAVLAGHRDLQKSPSQQPPGARRPGGLSERDKELAAMPDTGGYTGPIATSPSELPPLPSGHVRLVHFGGATAERVREEGWRYYGEISSNTTIWGADAPFTTTDDRLQGSTAIVMDVPQDVYRKHNNVAIASGTMAGHYVVGQLPTASAPSSEQQAAPVRPQAAEPSSAAPQAHEQTIEQHVRGNFDMAIDQAGEYGGLEGARDSFMQNTYDSVIEDGYTGDEALDAENWFITMFDEQTEADAVRQPYDMGNPDNAEMRDEGGGAQLIDPVTPGNQDAAERTLDIPARRDAAVESGAPAAPAPAKELWDMTKAELDKHTDAPTGMVRLYRVESNTVAADISISDWIKEDPGYKRSQKASKRYYTDDPSTLKFYANDHGEGKWTLKWRDVTPQEADKYRVSNIPRKEGGKDTEDNPQAFSRDYETEFFLPADAVSPDDTPPSEQQAVAQGRPPARPIFRDVEEAVTGSRLHRQVKSVGKSIPPAALRKMPGHTPKFQELAAKHGIYTDGALMMVLSENEHQKAKDAHSPQAGTSEAEAAATASLHKIAQSMLKETDYSSSAAELVAASSDGTYVLLQDSDGQSAVVNADLFRTVQNRYPNAVAHLPDAHLPEDKHRSVKIKSDGEVVAVLMPVDKKAENDIRDDPYTLETHYQKNKVASTGVKISELKGKPPTMRVVVNDEMTSLRAEKKTKTSGWEVSDGNVYTGKTGKTGKGAEKSSRRVYASDLRGKKAAKAMLRRIAQFSFGEQEGHLQFRPIKAEDAAPVSNDTAPAAAEADAVLQPYQMTREEFAEEFGNADNWSSVVRRNIEYGRDVPAHVIADLKAYDANRAGKAPPKPNPVNAKIGDTIIRYTHRDGTGLLNNSGLDRSKLTDNEEDDLFNLMDLGLTQPPSGTSGVFYFTKQGEKNHERMLRLLTKASKTGVVRTESALSSPPTWESEDGQLAVATSAAPVSNDTAPAAAETRPQSAAEPAAEPVDTRGQGVQYHGARGEVTLDDMGYANENNIYGSFQTFHTTDAKDIAKGYGRNSPTAKVYRVKELTPVKFYDMEKPFTDRARLTELFGDDPGIVGAAIDSLMDNGNAKPNLREVMDEMRLLSSGEGMSKSAVQELFDNVTYSLQEQGFGGMSHVGGLQTNRPSHKVKIYLDPGNQISLEDVDGPVADPAELDFGDLQGRLEASGVEYVGTDSAKSLKNGPNTYPTFIAPNGVRIGISGGNDIYYSPQKRSVMSSRNIVPEGTVIVEAIKTPTKDRGKGLASESMDLLIEAADASGTTLKMEVAPMKKLGATKALNQKQLMEWYQRKGFQRPDGEPDGSSILVRKPAKEAQTPSGEVLGAELSDVKASVKRMFTTAKGSTYVIEDDGTTSRDKAARDEPGHEGDSGKKERSAKTIYIDSNAAALSAAGLQNRGSKGARVVIKDGKASLIMWNEKADTWGVSPLSQDISFSTEPKVGSYPLELWDKTDDVPGYESYSNMHAGNKIISITQPAVVDERARPEAATGQSPTVAVPASGTVAQGRAPARPIKAEDAAPVSNDTKQVVTVEAVKEIAHPKHYTVEKNRFAKDTSGLEEKLRGVEAQIKKLQRKLAANAYEDPLDRLEESLELGSLDRSAETHRMAIRLRRAGSAIVVESKGKGEKQKFYVLSDGVVLQEGYSAAFTLEELADELADTADPTDTVGMPASEEAMPYQGQVTRTRPDPVDPEDRKPIGENWPTQTESKTEDRVPVSQITASIEAAVKDVNENFRWRVGRMGIGGRKLRGIYNRLTGIARTQKSNDLPGGLHEAAHALKEAVSDGGSLQKNMPPNVQSDLVELGKRKYEEEPVNGWLDEGFSEYVRMWGTVPDAAQEVAPNATTWFEKQFLPSLPNEGQAWRKVQAELQTWEQQGGAARIDQSLVRMEVWKEKRRKWKENAKKLLSAEAWFEMFLPYKRLDEQRAKQLGRPLRDDEETYGPAKAMRMSHYGQAQDWVRNGVRGWNNVLLSRPLVGIRDLVPQDQKNDFWVYAAARRTIALAENKPAMRRYLSTEASPVTYSEKDGFRYADGTAVPQAELDAAKAATYRDAGPWSEADARQVVADFGHKRFQEAFDLFREVDDAKYKFAGIASPTMKAVGETIMKNDAGDHIPMHAIFREIDNDYRAESSNRTSNAAQGTLGKRLSKRGSKRERRHPLEVMVEDLVSVIATTNERYIIDRVIAASEESRPDVGETVEWVTAARKTRSGMLEKWNDDGTATVRRPNDRRVVIRKPEHLRRSGNHGQLGYIINEVPPDLVKVADRSMEQIVDEIARTVRKQGGEVLLTKADGSEMKSQELAGEIMSFFTTARQVPGFDNPIVSYYDGVQKKVRWFEVDKNLMGALKGMSMQKLPAAVRWMTGPVRTMKMGNVIYNPSFGGVRNPMRDIAESYQTTASSESPLVIIRDTIMGFLTAGRVVGQQWKGLGQRAKQVATGDKSQAVTADPYAAMSGAMKFFQRYGGGISTMVGVDQAATMDLVREIEGDLGIIDVGKDLVGTIRDTIGMSESVARVREVDHLAKEMGIKDFEAEIPIPQVLKLLLASKENAGPDFSANGYIGRYVNQLDPFANVAFQAARTQLRALKRDPKKFAGRAATFMAGGILYWAINKDEEWYKRLGSAKYHNYYWKIGDNVLKLPRGQYSGTLIAGLIESMFDAAYQRDPDVLAQFAEQALEVLLPNTSPLVLQEARDQWKNEDSFFNMKIVPPGLETLPRSEQTDLYTTRLSTLIGAATDPLWPEWQISPKRLDHALKAFLGAAPLDALDLIGLGKASTGREWEAADFPVFGTLFVAGGTAGRRPKPVSDLYDLHQKFLDRKDSRRHPETETDKRTRLMLQDTTKSISMLSQLQHLGIPADGTGYNQWRMSMGRLIESTEDTERKGHLKALLDAAEPGQQLLSQKDQRSITKLKAEIAEDTLAYAKAGKLPSASMAKAAYDLSAKHPTPREHEFPEEFKARKAAALEERASLVGILKEQGIPAATLSRELARYYFQRHGVATSPAARKKQQTEIQQRLKSLHYHLRKD